MSARPSRLVLLGHPVAHSLSPPLQNAALRRAGIPLEYAALDVPPDKLPSTLAALAGEGAAGNVTIPHKEAVAARCASLTPLARRVGAVNVFWTEHGGLHGDNTDVGGFDAAVRLLLGRPPEGERVALLGAGGAAAAVLAAVERWDRATAAIFARTASRAEVLARRFPSAARATTRLADALDGATLVVNATPIGMRDDAFPADPDALPHGAAVLDLVYRRGETAWVRAARARGHAARDGLEMLVEQGALSFSRWLGVEPDRAAMRAALS